MMTLSANQSDTQTRTLTHGLLVRKAITCWNAQVLDDFDADDAAAPLILTGLDHNTHQFTRRIRILYAVSTVVHHTRRRACPLSWHRAVTVTVEPHLHSRAHKHPHMHIHSRGAHTCVRVRTCGWFNSGAHTYQRTCTLHAHGPLLDRLLIRSGSSLSSFSKCVRGPARGSTDATSCHGVAPQRSFSLSLSLSLSVSFDACVMGEG